MKRLVFLCLGVFVLGLACGKNPVKEPRRIEIRALLIAQVVTDTLSRVPVAHALVDPSSGTGEEVLTQSPDPAFTGEDGFANIMIKAIVDYPKDTGWFIVWVATETDTVYYPNGPEWIPFRNGDTVKVCISIAEGGRP